MSSSVSFLTQIARKGSLKVIYREMRSYFDRFWWASSETYCFETSRVYRGFINPPPKGG